MLLINPEVACFVVAKAREFGAKVELDDPDSGSNPADDKSIDVLEDYADDPTLDELRGAIDSMNEDESRDLVAMMWIGRGDFDKEQWRAARAQAASIPPRDRSRYLIGTPLLGDYLEQGMSEFGYSCEEYEMDRL